mgnify:FL=1
MKGAKRLKRKNRLRTNGMNPQHFSLGQIKIYLFLLPICVVMALPIIFIFVNALKPLDELFAYPPRFYVRNPTLNNFATLFSLSSTSNTPAGRYLFNSILASLLTVVFTLIIGTSAGYVLSKKHFRTRNVLLEINNLALMFCSVAVAIPRYFVIAKLGLLDTFWANVVPLLATPVGVFLIKQFIDGLPDALIEAAYIDGANDYQILFKIVMPLIKPALATLTIMTFQASWGATEASTLLINNESYKNFAFYLSTLSANGTVSGQGVAAAASLIMFLPNLIIFIFMQSKVMSTMAHSGIK